MPTERLTLKAIAEDEFSDVLNELENQLISIAALEREVFPIEAEVEGVATAIGELETLEETIDRIDDDLDVDAGVSAGSGSVDTGDGVATSGGRDTGGIDYLDESELAELRDEFGKAFDPSGLVSEGGRATPSDLLEGSFADFIDTDELGRAISNSNTDISLDDLSGFGRNADFDEFMDSFKALGGRNSDIMNLPDRRQGLAEQFLDLQFVMGDFFKVLAALIPLLGTFVGALPAAIAGLGALAGAALAAAGGLAAIGGLGLLGMAVGRRGLSFGRLQRRVQRLYRTFVQAFRPLMETFVPVVQEAFADLRFLIRDLGRYGGVLRTLTDDFTRLSHLLSRNLAPILADIVAFGDAAIPIFGALAARFPDVNVISVFADILVQTLPLIVSIATEIGRLLPIIFEMSTGFLAAAFGIMRVFGALAWMINLLPYGIKLFGLFVGVMISLVTVSALYTVISDSLDNGLLRLLPAIWKNIQAWRMMTWSEIKATLASISLGSALTYLMGIITFGIAPAVAALASGFGLLNNNIRAATGSLKQFNGVAGDTPALAGMGNATTVNGSGSGAVNYNEFVVNATDREQANRTTESLSYMQGTRLDSEFG